MPQLVCASKDDFSPAQASIKAPHTKSTIHCGKVCTFHWAPTMFVLVMLTFHKMLETGNFFVLVLQNDATAFSLGEKSAF